MKSLLELPTEERIALIEEWRKLHFSDNSNMRLREYIEQQGYYFPVETKPLDNKNEEE